MNFSNTYLKQCEELFRLGYKPEKKPGAIMARGFADIGYEVYSFIPESSLVSLLTGKVIPYDQQSEQHFFAIPSCDDLLNEIDKHGCDITTMAKGQGWNWRLDLVHEKSGTLLSVEESSLESLFTQSFHQVLLHDQNK